MFGNLRCRGFFLQKITPNKFWVGDSSYLNSYQKEKPRINRGFFLVEHSRRKSDFLDCLYFVKGGSRFFYNKKIEPFPTLYFAFARGFRRRHGSASGANLNKSNHAPCTAGSAYQHLSILPNKKAEPNGSTFLFGRA